MSQNFKCVLETKSKEQINKRVLKNANERRQKVSITCTWKKKQTNKKKEILDSDHWPEGNCNFSVKMVINIVKFKCLMLSLKENLINVLVNLIWLDYRKINY